MNRACSLLSLLRRPFAVCGGRFSLLVSVSRSSVPLVRFPCSCRRVLSLSLIRSGSLVAAAMVSAASQRTRPVEGARPQRTTPCEPNARFLEKECTTATGSECTELQPNQSAIRGSDRHNASDMSIGRENERPTTTSRGRLGSGKRSDAHLSLVGCSHKATPAHSTSHTRDIVPHPASMSSDTPNAALLASRAQTVPSNFSVSYASEGGLHIVSGRGCYLYSSTGSAYLDALNNVTHVGHANPQVNDALQRQQARVNTNTRYLSAGLNEYTARLLRTFPANSPVAQGKVALVSSGSEANDLAMRIARAHTRANSTAAGASSDRATSTAASPFVSSTAAVRSKELFLCFRHAYHGATQSVLRISPYKYLGPGGDGRPTTTIEVDLIDPRDREAGRRELKRVEHEMQEARRRGDRIAALFFEPVLSCAGQVWLDAAFLSSLCALVRACGGLIVCDEVQTGFGRLGHWWGCLSLGITPDVVTFGKSAGNGYPLAGLVASRAALRAFEQSGMEYFNSCAGTNSACAVGIAVLDCVEQQQLIPHAARVGSHLLQGLRGLAATCPLIYDVRGQGLFLGIELRVLTVAALQARSASASSPLSCQRVGPPVPVRLPQLPRRTLPRCLRGPVPCPFLSSGELCSWLCTALMLCTPLGVLVGLDGPLHNVVKIKPPMTFGERDADYTVESLRVCCEALRDLHPCCFPADVPACTRLPSKL